MGWSEGGARDDRAGTGRLPPPGGERLTRFHVELRRFPHVTRTFNLTAEELDTRIVRPWVAGGAFELNDRRWEPGRSKIIVYEGPELRPEEIGLGRGWANATRSGEDVTARVLEAASASVERFKHELLERVPLSLRAIVRLAGDSHPQARVSDRLALAERAVWELLHQRRVVLVEDGAELAPERWQRALLDWEAWSEETLVVR